RQTRKSKRQQAFSEKGPGFWAGQRNANPRRMSRPRRDFPGDSMSQANPSRDDFAALLEESFSDGHAGEGQVVRGTVTAIEKDMAIIDVGLKVEGRVPLKEFGAKAKDGQMKVGDTVEVYVERIENALGEAMLSREKARREESWVRLEEKFN